MRYDCDNCEAGFTSPIGLKHHRQTKHEGYRYDRNLCDAKFHRQLSLDEHKFKNSSIGKRQEVGGTNSS